MLHIHIISKSCSIIFIIAIFLLNYIRGHIIIIFSSILIIYNCNLPIIIGSSLFITNLVHFGPFGPFGPFKPLRFNSVYLV